MAEDVARVSLLESIILACSKSLALGVQDRWRRQAVAAGAARPRTWRGAVEASTDTSRNLLNRRQTNLPVLAARCTAQAV